MIPYNTQKIFPNDLIRVKKSLKNKIITGGKIVKSFENSIKKNLKCNYVISCANGTAALHLSLMALSFRKDDFLIMPIVNFISSSNIASILNINIIYCDVDPITGQITPELLNKCLKKNKLKKIKAVMLMYLGGYADNIEQFYNLKKKYKFLIIEDGCHAFGSEYIFKQKKFKIGSCKHSDICTFSFHPLKTITTGEGGAVCVNNKKIYDNLIKLRSHGIKRNDNKHWKYDVIFPGLNYRISDLNCALGLSQLGSLKKILKKRKLLAKKYSTFFLKYNNFIKVRFINYGILNSYHLFIISIDFKKLKKNKNNMMNFFKSKNIFLQQHYIPINQFRYYKKKISGKFPNSKKYIDNTLSVPLYFSLNDYNFLKITNTFKKFFQIEKI